MGKILPVTSNQGDAIRDMANEKGVGRARWQRAHDDGRFGSFLDRLKTDVIPPEGARIHTVRSWVRQDRPWAEAVNAAGPDTPPDYNVRKVGNLYLPTGTIEGEQEHVFLNYPNGDGNWDKALAWGKEVKLSPTVPREVFAVGEQHPHLHRALGINPMCVVATTGCIFGGNRQACYVWWNDARRKALLLWVGSFGNACDWFAFRKGSVSGT